MGKEMPGAVSPKRSREQKVEVPLVVPDLQERVVQVLLVAQVVGVTTHLPSLDES